MKQDKETKRRLLESAREEFMEKGYMKASLRNICRNAGVTTGALYFFFEDKEDLFQALTKEAVDGIYQIMQSHFQEESEMLGKGMLLEPVSQEEREHLDITAMVVHQMYLRRDDILLVLTKSQGSSLENIVDSFIETAEIHFETMALKMQAAYPGKVLDEKFVHWLAHEMIDAFIYTISHIEDEQQAHKFMSQMTTYMMSGWYGLFSDQMSQ